MTAPSAVGVMMLMPPFPGSKKRGSKEVELVPARAFRCGWSRSSQWDSLLHGDAGVGKAAATQKGLKQGPQQRQPCSILTPTLVDLHRWSSPFWPLK